MPKFRADPSFVRRVNGHSKFRKSRNSRIYFRKGLFCFESIDVLAELIPRPGQGLIAKIEIWMRSFHGIKRNIAFTDQILPHTKNWSTNHNLALFSKLPTNDTKIPEKVNNIRKCITKRGILVRNLHPFSEILV